MLLFQVWPKSPIAPMRCGKASGPTGCGVVKANSALMAASGSPHLSRHSKAESMGPRPSEGARLHAHICNACWSGSSVNDC